MGTARAAMSEEGRGVVEARVARRSVAAAAAVNVNCIFVLVFLAKFLGLGGGRLERWKGGWIEVCGWLAGNIWIDLDSGQCESRLLSRG